MKRAKTYIALISILFLGLSSVQSATSSEKSPKNLITCTNIENSHERISRTGDCRIGREFTSGWHLAAPDSKIDLTSSRTMILCSNKIVSPVEYKVIRAKCAKHQISTEYFRSKVKPSQLVIETVTATGHDSAQIILRMPLRTDLDNPIAFYTVTPSTGLAQRVPSWKELSVTINTLSALTSYTFTITATSVDGTSVASAASQKITTSAYTPPPSSGNSTPALAAPVFTLSAIAETKTVNTSISGYTIASTGGTIASYAISPAAPAGTTFNTATGLLTGTPTATQSSTAYTITATNASGSATRTFTLTVISAVYTVGQRGPGGGIVFYVSAATFASPGSTCNTNGLGGISTCKYLEVAPAGWNNAAVVAVDPLLSWSNSALYAGQDSRTATLEGSNVAEEKANWKIGTGFYNTSIMKIAGATSGSQAAVLAFAGTDSSAGQWFLPSMNELNELCKYALGQTTGNPGVRCDGSGAIKSGTSNDLQGFVDAAYYLSSTEHPNATQAWMQLFQVGAGGSQNTTNKDAAIRVRPIRAI